MTEALFYHLEKQPLEAVLPSLLSKSLERGWRAVVQVGSPERLESIDSHLWTFSDESFLAHGTMADGHSNQQPVYLTIADDNPNLATIRFLVDRASLPADISQYARLVLIFDGNDQDALSEARSNWKMLKDQGVTVTYWQQRENGGWENRG